jgi:hypothetical protein
MATAQPEQLSSVAQAFAADWGRAATLKPKMEASTISSA